MELPNLPNINLKSPEEGHEKLLELAFFSYQKCFSLHNDHVQILNQVRSKLNELDAIKWQDPPSLIKIIDLPVNSPQWSGISEKIRQVKKRFPNCKVGGLTAKQIASHNISTGQGIKDLLTSYKKAGVDFLLSDDLFFNGDEDFSFSAWLEVHRLAHKMGLKSDLALRLRDETAIGQLWLGLPMINELQKETRGFFLAYVDSPHLPFIKQILVCSFARTVLSELADIGFFVSQNNLLTAQLTMSFGVSVLIRSSKDDSKGFLLSEVRTAIRKAKRKALPYGVAYDTEPTPPLDFMSLYKLQHNSELTAKELFHTIAHYPLPAVGILTKKRAEPKDLRQFHFFHCQKLPKTHLSPGEKELFIDFSNFEKNDSIDMDWLFTFIRKGAELRHCTLIGLHGLWQLSHKLQIQISDLFAKFSELGVDTIASSEDETEINLTTSEVISIHRLAHEQGMGSVAKLEISAPYNGKDIPFWDDFIRRLLAFKQLNRQTKKLKGIIVQESQGAFISLYEYLKAIALTNIVSDASIEVSAPLRTLNQGILKPKLVNKKSLNELIPIFFQFGASNVGLLGPQGIEDIAEGFDGIT